MSIRDIEDLGLGDTALKALEEGGISRYEELRWASREELLAIDGVGPATADAIEAWKAVSEGPEEPEEPEEVDAVYDEVEYCVLEACERVAREPGHNPDPKELEDRPGFAEAWRLIEPLRQAHANLAIWARRHQR